LNEKLCYKGRIFKWSKLSCKEKAAEKHTDWGDDEKDDE
jgi:hypothetical protein